METYKDYLVILSPPQGIKNKVKKYKELSSKVIGKYESIYSKAHITVQPWPRKRRVWIDQMIPKIERELSLMPPLSLDVKGFNFFQGNDAPTIYAELQSTDLTKEWFKKLRKCLDAEPRIPHITITRTIAADAFKKLWPHFKNKRWNEHFEIHELIIPERETIGHDRNYKVFKRIPFNKNYTMESVVPLKKADKQLTNKAAHDQQLTLF